MKTISKNIRAEFLYKMPRRRKLSPLSIVANAEVLSSAFQPVRANKYRCSFTFGVEGFAETETQIISTCVNVMHRELFGGLVKPLFDLETVIDLMDDREVRESAQSIITSIREEYLL